MSPKAQENNKRAAGADGVAEDTALKKRLRSALQYAEKTGTEQEKAGAAKVSEHYKSLKGEVAASFAKKFLDAKKGKDFAWNKDYVEILTAKTVEDTSIKENYMTRQSLAHI